MVVTATAVVETATVVEARAREAGEKEAGARARGGRVTEGKLGSGTPCSRRKSIGEAIGIRQPVRALTAGQLRLTRVQVPTGWGLNIHAGQVARRECRRIRRRRRRDHLARW